MGKIEFLCLVICSFYLDVLNVLFYFCFAQSMCLQFLCFKTKCSKAELISFNSFLSL